MALPIASLSELVAKLTNLLRTSTSSPTIFIIWSRRFVSTRTVVSACGGAGFFTAAGAGAAFSAGFCTGFGAAAFTGSGFLTGSLTLATGLAAGFGSEAAGLSIDLGAPDP